MKLQFVGMIHISLFSGICGFDLAADEIGWDNYASCEIADFGHKILSFYWPHAYHHRDIKTLTFKILNEELTKRFGPNWQSRGIVLSGGFPCQGFSVAGLRAGTDDDRYLWPEYLRLIDEIKPDWVCGENVTGILTMEDKSGIYRDVFAKVENRKVTRLYPVDHYEAVYTRQVKMLVGSICEDLEERGYEVQTFAIPAASVEAPHKRERIWFVAHSESVRGNREKRNVREADGRSGAGQLSEFEQPGCGYVQGGVVTNPGGSRTKQQCGESDKSRKLFQKSERNQIEQQYQFTGESRNAPNPNSLQSRRPGHGETGPAQGELQEIEKERERVRPIAERTGDKEPTTNSDFRTGRTICRHETYIGGENKEITEHSNFSSPKSATNAQRNGSGKSMEGEQSEQFNADGEAERNDAYTSSPGREECELPGLAARPGHRSRGDNEGFRRGFDNFPTQPPVCSRNDGLSDRLDGITFSKWRNESIKGFGNAVVPQAVLEIFKAIDAYERSAA